MFKHHVSLGMEIWPKNQKLDELSQEKKGFGSYYFQMFIGLRFEVWTLKRSPLKNWTGLEQVHAHSLSSKYILIVSICSLTLILFLFCLVLSPTQHHYSLSYSSINTHLPYQTPTIISSNISLSLPQCSRSSLSVWQKIQRSLMFM